MILSFLLIGISVGIFASITVIWNMRTVEGEILGASIALIFALPAFRATAPQNPPYGRYFLQ